MNDGGSDGNCDNTVFPCGAIGNVEKDDWSEFTLPDIVLEKGDNCIRLYNANGDFQLDCIYILEK